MKLQLCFVEQNCMALGHCVRVTVSSDGEESTFGGKASVNWTYFETAKAIFVYAQVLHKRPVLILLCN